MSQLTSGFCHTEAEIDVILGEANSEFGQMLIESKRIQLPYSLVADGLVNGPPGGDWTLLQKIFPKATSVELRAPYMIVRVPELPPKPWPMTVGNLPFHFMTAEHGETFKRGTVARGPPVLKDLDLTRSTKFSKDVLWKAAQHFMENGPKIRDLYWFAGFWQATFVDEVDPKSVPWRVAGSPLWFHSAAENPDPDPAALRKKIPLGTDYDDTDYATAENALLRPGIMVSSSFIEEVKNGSVERNWTMTTSGVLVVDAEGNIFITVASHGFNSDGLVYHPNPETGKVIGQIVASLPDIEISIVKLNKGLRYTNETCGSAGVPPVTVKEIAASCPPQTKVYDSLSMTNPYSGQCDGSVLALGVRVGRSDSLVLHEWICLDNRHELIRGSCGCPITDKASRVLGFFRFMKEDSSECLCVAAEEIRRFGYEICGGEQVF